MPPAAAATGHATPPAPPPPARRKKAARKTTTSKLNAEFRPTDANETKTFLSQGENEFRISLFD